MKIDEYQDIANLSEPMVNQDNSINMEHYYINRSQEEEVEQKVSKIIFTNSQPVRMPLAFTHKRNREKVVKFKKH